MSKPLVRKQVEKSKRKKCKSVISSEEEESDQYNYNPVVYNKKLDLSTDEDDSDSENWKSQPGNVPKLWDDKQDEPSVNNNLYVNPELESSSDDETSNSSDDEPLVNDNNLYARPKQRRVSSDYDENSYKIPNKGYDIGTTPPRRLTNKSAIGSILPRRYTKKSANDKRYTSKTGIDTSNVGKIHVDSGRFKRSTDKDASGTHPKRSNNKSITYTPRSKRPYGINGKGNNRTHKISNVQKPTGKTTDKCSKSMSSIGVTSMVKSRMSGVIPTEGPIDNMTKSTTNKMLTYQEQYIENVNKDFPTRFWKLLEHGGDILRELWKYWNGEYYNVGSGGYLVSKTKAFHDNVIGWSQEKKISVKELEHLNYIGKLWYDLSTKFGNQIDETMSRFLHTLSLFQLVTQENFQRVSREIISNLEYCVHYIKWKLPNKKIYPLLIDIFENK